MDCSSGILLRLLNGNYDYQYKGSYRCRILLCTTIAINQLVVSLGISSLPARATLILSNLPETSLSAFNRNLSASFDSMVFVVVYVGQLWY